MLQAALADAEAKRNAEAKEYQSAMSQVVEAEARLARMVRACLRNTLPDLETPMKLCSHWLRSRYSHVQASSAANDVNTERRHRIGLEARVSELIRQVEAASANCHRQKDEAEELRQQLKGLHEAKLALAVSCAAAQEREALLQACPGACNAIP